VESSHNVRVGVRGRAAQQSDHRHPRLLRSRTNWPRDRRAAKEADELAPSQTIGPHCHHRFEDRIHLTRNGKSRSVGFGVYVYRVRHAERDAGQASCRARRDVSQAGSTGCGMRNVMRARRAAERGGT
jgi:hypothetical protein